MAESAEHAAKTINTRIEMMFKRKSRTQYHIEVVNDKFDNTYNFFLVSMKKDQRPHSTPIHTVENYDLSVLEQIMRLVQKEFQLSIDYVGFTGERWPESFKVIQKKPKADEFQPSSLTK